MASVVGGSNQDLFGHSVAIIADVDADGHDDVAVGAPNWSGSPYVIPETGRVYVYSGLNGGLIRSHSAGQAYGHFGWAVARGGDMDGDGVGDYIVGRPDYDSGSDADVGQVRVFSGQSGALLSALTVTGTQAGARLGYAVAGDGDVNGDGVPDYAYGEPYRDGGYGPPPFPLTTPDMGLVTVRSGANGSVIFSGTSGAIYGRMGTSLSIWGDANHDGFCEVLGGAPGVGSGDGQAVLWCGRTHTKMYTIDGEGGEALGQSVAQYRFCQTYPGGYADFAVGRPSYDIIGPGSASDVGGWSIYYGKVSWALPLPGDVPRFGHSVALLEDVNLDGWDDLAVGSYDPSGLPSSYWMVFCGRTSKRLYQSPSQGCWGFAMAGLGDLNGDNRAEIVLGDPCAPLVQVRSAYDGSSLPSLSWTSSANSNFGHSVANAGDLDGDGLDDVLIGAPHINSASTAGAAYVYSGSNGSLLRTIQGGQIQERFGWDVADAGDVDGDGTPDQIVGAPWSVNALGQEVGRAEVISGATSTPILVVSGANSGNTHAGWSVAGIGDVNGDGFDDVVVGEPDYETSLTLAKVGRVRVFLGGPVGSSHSMLHEVIGTVANGRFGLSVCAIGDVDNDGAPDFAAGRPHGSPSRAVTISGATGQELLYYWSGVDVGWALDGRRDHTDSRQELVIGAPNGSSGGSSGYARMMVMPWARQTTIGTGCGAPPPSNQANIVVIPHPFIGELCRLWVGYLKGYTVAQVWYSAPTSSYIDLGSGCTLYLDPLSLGHLIDLVTDGTGQASVDVLIPDIPAWAGVVIRLQGVCPDSWSSAPLGFRLTAACDIQFGF